MVPSQAKVIVPPLVMAWRNDVSSQLESVAPALTSALRNHKPETQTPR